MKEEEKTSGNNGTKKKTSPTTRQRDSTSRLNRMNHTHSQFSFRVYLIPLIHHIDEAVLQFSAVSTPPHKPSELLMRIFNYFLSTDRLLYIISLDAHVDHVVKVRRTQMHVYDRCASLEFD